MKASNTLYQVTVQRNAWEKRSPMSPNNDVFRSVGLEICVCSRLRVGHDGLACASVLERNRKPAQLLPALIASGLGGCARCAVEAKLWSASADARHILRNSQAEDQASEALRQALVKLYEAMLLAGCTNDSGRKAWAKLRGYYTHAVLMLDPKLQGLNSGAVADLKRLIQRVEKLLNVDDGCEELHSALIKALGGSGCPGDVALAFKRGYAAVAGHHSG